VRITVLPKTSLGRWSVGLAAAFILLFVLFQTFAASVRCYPVPNPGLPSPVIVMAVVADYISGIAAFVIGLISIIKSKERSILVYLAIFIGFDILVFCLGEVLVPH